MFRFQKLRYVIRRISLESISNEIKVPKKIYRDELSVLKALSNCVQTERGSILHSVIDQPATLPVEFYKSKKFYWSKLSGKLSAKMVLNEIRNEFLNVAFDEPRVKGLMPMINAEDVAREVQENKITPDKGLDKIVRLLSPEDAWAFYNKHKSTQFSSEVIQKLLELLCVTNGVSPVLKDEFKIIYSQMPMVEWSIKTNAELLFAEIDKKTENSYCAIIRGAAKFNDSQRALQHFNQMKEHFPECFPDLATINSLLRGLRCSNMSDEEMKTVIVGIFEGMIRHNISPTTHTFNNAIFAFSKRHSVDFIVSLYSELVSVGLEPTLGTYSLLLQCQFNGSALLAMVEDILWIIESRDIDYEETTSVDDRTLFNNMNDIIRDSNAVDLGFRLMNVVDRGGCFHLFLSDLDRSNFIGTFVRLLILSQRPLGYSLDIVSRYVPTYYSLNLNQIEYVISRIRKLGKIDLLTKLFNIVSWRAKYLFTSNTFSQVLEMFLSADYSDEQFRQSVSESMSRFIDESLHYKTSMLQIDGNMAKAVRLATKIADDDLCWSMIDYADQNGIVHASVVTSVMVHCFQTKNFERVSYLWQCLARSVNSRVMVALQEREALKSLISMVDEQMMPVMVLCNANVVDIRQCIDVCNNWLAQDLTMEDFDREDSERKKMSGKTRNRVR